MSLPANFESNADAFATWMTQEAESVAKHAAFLQQAVASGERRIREGRSF